MSNDHTWRAGCLVRLRAMLGRMIDERNVVAPTDPEKAGHLTDATVDLQTLIERLENDVGTTTAAGAEAAEAASASRPASDDRQAGSEDRNSSAGRRPPPDAMTCSLVTLSRAVSRFAAEYVGVPMNVRPAA